MEEQEEAEDPLHDLERAFDVDVSPNTSLSDAPCRPLSGSDRSAAPSPETQKINRSHKPIPKYWDSTLPLKGETKEEAAAAAKRARTRIYNKKSYIYELAGRNHTLCRGDYPRLMGHGTPPVAVDIGDLRIRHPCTQIHCEMHDSGWPPDLSLAIFSHEFLRQRLDELGQELTTATSNVNLARVAAEIRAVKELERKRCRQVYSLVGTGA